MIDLDWSDTREALRRRRCRRRCRALRQRQQQQQQQRRICVFAGTITSRIWRQCSISCCRTRRSSTSLWRPMDTPSKPIAWSYRPVRPIFRFFYIAIYTRLTRDSFISSWNIEKIADYLSEISIFWRLFEWNFIFLRLFEWIFRFLYCHLQ